MIYAQIKSSIVDNTIIIDNPDLIPVFKQGYDYIIAIGEITPQPSIGWSYDAQSNTFSTPVIPLEQLKDDKYVQIDIRTGELIGQGFIFGGHTFSMSLNAQINWSNFPNLPDALFPLTIIDITESPYVCSLVNKMNFYYSALNGKNGYLQSGGVLKATIKACVDEACVTAITDNR